jgi:opacity protein-like surface antigen
VGSPRLWHLHFTAQSHNLLVRHASLNPLKADDLLSGGGLNGGVELSLVPRLVVGAEVGWVGGRFEDTVFGTDTTAVEAHSLRAGVRVGYRLWDAVTPYVRGGFTATWLAARIRTDTQSLGGRAFAPGAYALGGVELTIRRSWMRKAFGSGDFTMGLVFEAGWVHLGRFDLSGGKDSEGLLDDHRAGLGRLTLEGVTVNAGLVLVF